jgi:hypothetical protein
LIYNPWISIFLSAFLYSIPFLAPHYFWWALFLFPLPLLMNRSLSIFSFQKGYVWGLIIFFLHLLGINQALITLSKGHILIKIIPCIILIVYQSLFAGFFFWLGSFIEQKFFKNNVDIQIIIRTLVLLCFIWYLDFLCLFMTGKIEGYCLMHPLIPLAQHPQLLRIILFSNKFIATIFLFAFSLSYAFYFHKRNNIRLSFAFFITIVWGLLYFIPQSLHERPNWLQKISALPHTFVVPHNMTFLMNAVAHECKKIIEKNPSTEIIIMPESSLYCTALHMPELTTLLSRQYIGKPIHFIAGAFAWQGNNYHNAMYWIYDGTLKNCYYKRHTMFLTEHIPPWLKKTFFERLFFSQSAVISSSTNPRPLLKLQDNITLIPYICSELFFNKTPDDSYQN